MVLLIHFVPELRPYQVELTDKVAVLAGIVISAIAAEDILKNPVQKDEVNKDIADTLNDAIALVTPEALKEVVPKLTEDEIARILALLLKNVTPTT